MESEELVESQESAESAKPLSDGADVHNGEFSPSQDVDDNYRTATTQVPDEFFPYYKFEEKSDLATATRTNLLREYHKTVTEYMRSANTSEMSDLRAEICSRIQKRSRFQTNLLGPLSAGLDEPPPNLYSSRRFTASLFLMIFENGQFKFTTCTSPPTILCAGRDIDGAEGHALLMYISQGILKPGLLRQLLDLNLTWYDGCLICEITDERRKLKRTVRTQLKVAQEDIVEITSSTSSGLETEQHFLMAQYPLLCLEPDKQVGNVARAAHADRRRWEPSAVERESKIRFVARKRPELFIKTATNGKPEVTQTDEDAFRKKMIQRLMTDYKPQ